MNILKKIKKNRHVTVIRRRTGYIFFLLGYYCARVLPRPAVPFIGKALGRFVFFAIRYARKTVFDNLNRAFGGKKTKEELYRIAKESYEHLGMTVFEFLKNPSLSRDEILGSIEYKEQMDKIYALLKEGRGVIAVSGHVGNWEMLAALGAKIGLDMSVLVEPLTNPYINRFLDKLRRGNKLIDVSSESNKALSALRSNGVLCVLIDENAREKGVMVDFFGVPASTYKGPAYFALRVKAPIACVYLLRDQDYRFRFIVERVIRPGGRNDMRHDIKDILTQIHESLEKVITEYPAQWNWIYKRWG
jgi:KDO2-lipid IV(A) lauroyltransferase